MTCDLDAECCCLGAVFCDPGLVGELLTLLEEQDFAWQAHRTIYRAMMEVVEGGRRVDLLSVSETIVRSGKKEDLGGLEYLLLLRDSCPSPANFAQHAEVVKERALWRRGGLMAVDLEKMCVDLAPHGEVAAAAFRLATLMRGGVRGNRVLRVSDVLHGVWENLQKGGGSGSPTGFSDFDRLTGGLPHSSLVVVAARPSRGKSAFALTLAHEFARRGEPVYFLSLEMDKESLVRRLLSMTSGVNLQRLHVGASEEECNKMAGVVDRLASLPLVIDDDPTTKPIIARHKAEGVRGGYAGRLGLIVVDYLQLMGADQDVDSREERVGAVINSLKSIAQELQCPLLAVSQLSRAIEQRGHGASPKLSDLRESGSIEQAADQVLFLQSSVPEEEGGAQDRRSQPHEVEVVVAKNRNGPTGSVRLTFIPARTLFVSRSTRVEGAAVV